MSLSTAKSSDLCGPLHHTLASQGASAIATFAFFPLDTVKMRFMSQDGTKERLHNHTYYRHTFPAIRQIAVSEGVVVLYRGVHVAILGATVAWGVYMYLYRLLLGHLPRGLENSFWGAAGSSLLASGASAVFTCPIWLIKTRMQVEEAGRLAAQTAIHYGTFRGGLRYMIQTTGYRSLWRGLSAQLLLSVPNCLNVPIYDAAKRWRRGGVDSEEMSVADVTLCASISKISLSLMTHPFFVIKTRLQDHRSMLGEVHYMSLHQAVRTTMTREGVPGLYRGFVPSLMQALPRGAAQFLLYEAFLSTMRTYLR